MPLLREEAEKLSNNELEQGVIETIIDRDDLFAILPFMKINSKAYLYNREKTLSEATFIDVNDTITEGAATFEEKVAKLRILAGGNVFAGMGPAAETGCKSVTLLL